VLQYVAVCFRGLLWAIKSIAHDRKSSRFLAGVGVAVRRGGGSEAKRGPSPQGNDSRAGEMQGGQIARAVRN